MKKLLLLFAIIILVFSGCKDSEPNSVLLPTLTTTTINEITQTTATCGGVITADAGLNVTVRGICWGITDNPTITTNKTTDGVGVGTFSSLLVGLTPGTTYFVRAYATNSAGTAYGNSNTFTTKPAIVYGSMTDIDGNNYKTITIGTQTWMAENLRTTKYNNGDLIGTTTTPTQNISSDRDPRYQWAYNGDETKVAKYGRLYTWWVAHETTSTIISGSGTIIVNHNIAPTGWHVSTDTDWTTLKSYLVTNGIVNMAKALSATTDWLISSTDGNVGNDLSKNNSTGFSAIPCGMRYSTGGYDDLGSYAYWWSTSSDTNGQAWGSIIGYNYYSPEKLSREYAYGFSVRCIKN